MVRARLSTAAAILFCGALEAFSQSPPPEPTTPELPCQAAAGTDDVSAPLDSGFVSIFNGKDLKGWWNNCNGEDANHLVSSGGGVYKVDPVAKAIYTQQRATGPGGSALCTNKKYGNQEIIVEYWADFGNDAGIYHRTTDKAIAYQTVIDYKQGNCVGGSYPQEMESVVPNSVFYNCAYWFSGSETGAFSGSVGNAGITNKASLVQADMYDPNGWNELRVKIYGNPPRHQAWMRKLGGANWVQTLDVTWPAGYGKVVSQTGYTAIQVHGNGYWNKTKVGDWYRNIRVRELDNSGAPLVTTSARFQPKTGAYFSANRAGLYGWLEKDYQIKVTDINGKILESFHAGAGDISHSFGNKRPQGMLFIEMKAGAETRILRIPSL